MEIIYRTCDGVIFEKESEARAHEAIDVCGSLTMWNRNGEVTTDTNQAYVVLLGTEEAAEAFLAMNNAEEMECIGIEPDSTGIYLWNDWDQRYDWLDFDCARGAKKAVEMAEEKFFRLVTPVEY